MLGFALLKPVGKVVKWKIFYQHESVKYKRARGRDEVVTECWSVD